MFTKKSRLIAGVLALILAVGLASCGDDDDPSSTVPGGSVVTEPVGS